MRSLYGDGPYVDPQVGDYGPLTALTIEPLWVALTYTPIYPADAKAGKVYCVRAGGIITTSASASTLIITPLLTATALGVSLTHTLPVSLSNVAWRLKFDLVIRTIAAGAASTCIGTGIFVTAPKASAPTAGQGQVLTFGGTSATVDFTIIEAIGISKTLAGNAGSVTTQYCYMFARN